LNRHRLSIACISGTSIMAVCVAKANGGTFSRHTGTGKKGLCDEG
jgi:hypothetical protein